MKTKKEEANELVSKYWSYSWNEKKTKNTYKSVSMTKAAAKMCALIAVKEKISQVEKMASYWDLKSGEWYKDELLELAELKKEVELL